MYLRLFAGKNMSIDMTNFMTYYRTMISININKVKANLSSYLARVAEGETVVICKRNIPIAELRPLAVVPKKKRPVGLAGKEYPGFRLSDTFFEPLPADIEAAFNGKEP